MPTVPPSPCLLCISVLSQYFNPVSSQSSWSVTTDSLFLSHTGHRPLHSLLLPSPQLALRLRFTAALLSFRFSLQFFHTGFPSPTARAQLILCTSAGFLKLWHGNVVRRTHGASPSLLLRRNWTISFTTVFMTALGRMACDGKEIVVEMALFCVRGG